ncbi:MAG: hypothetical protein LQ348_001846 [Seirophora lacunosa]|nr:MAG: hypothetical protein LQ348_001846 [Seirophora lacunosa]
MENPTNLLDYLKSKTQVDVDSLDIRASQAVDKIDIRLKADAYTELLNPRHADLLKKTAALANEIKAHYHSVNFEELAMELSVSRFALMSRPD